MKMISIDDIIEICDTNILPLKARGQGVAVAALRRVIDAAKEYAVDAELVKHGRWIVKNGSGEYGWCSECGNRSWTQWDGVMPIPLLTPFCPYCSARMDKEAE